MRFGFMNSIRQRSSIGSGFLSCTPLECPPIFIRTYLGYKSKNVLLPQANFQYRFAVQMLNLLERARGLVQQRLGGRGLADVPRVDRAPALMVKLIPSSDNSFIDVYYFYHNPPWCFSRGGSQGRKILSMGIQARSNSKTKGKRASGLDSVPSSKRWASLPCANRQQSSNTHSLGIGVSRKKSTYFDSDQ